MLDGAMGGRCGNKLTSSNDAHIDFITFTIDGVWIKRLVGVCQSPRSRNRESSMLTEGRLVERCAGSDEAGPAL